VTGGGGGGDADAWKRAAAEAAVALVEDGMAVGLGTGSTSAFAVSALAARVRAEGLRVVGIPTSERTAEQARREGVPLTTFAEHPELDLAIDGADEVERGTLHLVKGGGGALLREKIVAAASRRFVVVADEGKLVDRLGVGWAVPVEVVPFGWEATARRIGGLGATPELRRKDGEPFVTDGGHLILDCRFPGGIADPPGLERLLGAIVGVVETGLFTGMAGEVLLAGPGGVRRLTPGG
jgi:ribose 5-phosphate isomerase A